MQRGWMLHGVTWRGLIQAGIDGQVRDQPPPADWANHDTERKVVSHLGLNGLRNLSLRENRRRSCNLHSNVILLEMALSVYSGFVACSCILRDLNLNVSFPALSKSANIFFLLGSYDAWEFVCDSLPQMEGGKERGRSDVGYLRFGCKTALHYSLLTFSRGLAGGPCWLVMQGLQLMLMTCFSVFFTRRCGQAYSAAMCRLDSFLFPCSNMPDNSL